MKKFLCVFLCSIIISANAYTKPIQMKGLKTQIIPTHLSTRSKRSYDFSSKAVKTVPLLHVLMSQRHYQPIIKRKNRVLSTQLTPSSTNHLPHQVQLGMGQLKPLNQGPHGSCVTFANMAAIEVLLDLKNNHISQLCTLALGKYFERLGYGLSGWEGASGLEILNRATEFGVAYQSQEANGCGGLNGYPLSNFGETGTEMSLDDYHQISHNIQHKVTFTSLLDSYQASSDDLNLEKLLYQVKKTIALGHRLTTGVILYHTDLGVAGAVGTFRQQYDTWLVDPFILADENIDDLAGHEMIITGFDDTAEVKDSSGQVHRGLLTLRNSWGSDVGNSGDFYMTYDYFLITVLELNEIRAI